MKAKISVELPKVKLSKFNLPRVQKALTQCLQCGYCIEVCEAHNQTPWESVTPRGKIYYIKAIDTNGMDIVDTALGRKIELSDDFVDAMYKCTGCGNCEVVCHAHINLVDLWEEMREWMFKNGAGPLPAHKGIAVNVKNKHNSFGESPAKRDAWWPADIERAAVPDAIFFAGCTGSYRMQQYSFSPRQFILTPARDRTVTPAVGTCSIL